MKRFSIPRIGGRLLAALCAICTVVAPAVAAPRSFGGGHFGGFGGGHFGGFGGRAGPQAGFGGPGRFAGRPGGFGPGPAGFGPRAFGFPGGRGFGEAHESVRHDVPFGPRVGGRVWGWRDAAIAEGAVWASAWGLGAGFGVFAPPVAFVPAPLFVALPPVVVSVPWLDATAPVDVLPAVAPAVATAPAPNYVPSPEAMLCAALPPPVVVMPPAEVMIEAAPPPVIFAPPVEALSIWPVLAFAPPILAVAVLHDDWWSGSYHGLGGYHVGAFYAERGVDHGFGVARPLLAAAEVSRHDSIAGFGRPGFAPHDGAGLLREPGAARAGFARSPGDVGRLGTPAVAFAHAEGGPRLGAGGFGHGGGGGFHGGGFRGGFGGGRGR